MNIHWAFLLMCRNNIYSCDEPANYQRVKHSSIGEIIDPLTSLKNGTMKFFYLSQFIKKLQLEEHQSLLTRWIFRKPFLTYRFRQLAVAAPLKQQRFLTVKIQFLVLNGFFSIMAICPQPQCRQLETMGGRKYHRQLTIGHIPRSVEFLLE